MAEEFFKLSCQICDPQKVLAVAHLVPMLELWLFQADS
jgi:hypothetical protein